MKSNRPIGLALIVLLFIMTFAVLSVPQSRAQSQPVFPNIAAGVLMLPNWYSEPLPLGNQFNVSIIFVGPKLDLCAWQIRLQWDPNILTCNSVYVLWNSLDAYYQINNTLGQVWIYQCFVGIAANLTFTPHSLSKMLAITFQPVGYGQTSINITTCDLLGASDLGNGWTPGTDPYEGIPEFTKYDRWCDVNNDGVVDEIDAIKFAACLGSTNGTSAYGNGACDFNNDGVVDVIDASILALDFGKSDGANVTNTVFLFNDTVEQNGKVYTTIPGDINGDGIVDIYDAILLSAAFNTTSSSPNWNPNADLNGDGIVDIYDAIIQSANFGQHYP